MEGYNVFMYWASMVMMIWNVLAGVCYKNKGKENDAIYNLVWGAIFVTIHFYYRTLQ